MKILRDFRLFFKSLGRDETGAIGIALLILFPVCIGFATLAVDAPYLYETKNKLQVGADAAALAADQFIGAYTSTTVSTPCSTGNTWALCSTAIAVAAANGTTIKNPATDIIVGYWGPNKSNDGVFTPNKATNTVNPNAVEVITKANTTTFFTAALSTIASGAGFNSMNLAASAVAAFTAANGSGGGSGINTSSNLIIVTDISGSFAATIPNAQAAAQDCIKDFAKTGGSYSNLGLTLFGGSSPQSTVTGGFSGFNSSFEGGWSPQGWTTAGWNPPAGATTAPYQGLAAVNNPTTFQSAFSAQVAASGDCSTAFGTSNPQYSCSGSNIASGIQSAVNQFCNNSGCQNGTMQMVVITDGVPNCTTSSGSKPGNWGTSGIAGQNCLNGGTDTTLLNEATALSKYAGSLGITLSTIYYSGDTTGGSSVVNQYTSELQNLVNTNSSALTSKLGENALQGQFFSEPTGTNLANDMQEICAGAANGNKPRLVL